MTQKQLAERADISRATIAQIETGVSDPRLSTLAYLADALDIPLLLLLANVEEVTALSGAFDAGTDSSYARLSAGLSEQDANRMRRYLQSGMLKDRLRAATLGATAGRRLSDAHLAEAFAAVFSAILPGSGTITGIRLAELLAETRGCPVTPREPAA